MIDPRGGQSPDLIIFPYSYKYLGLLGDRSDRIAVGERKVALLTPRSEEPHSGFSVSNCTVPPEKSLRVIQILYRRQETFDLESFLVLSHLLRLKRAKILPIGSPSVTPQ